MRYTGFDKNGIARVYAEDDFHQTASAFCHEEASAYVKRRPDTGPLSSWTFTHNEPILETEDQS